MTSEAQNCTTDPAEPQSPVSFWLLPMWRWLVTGPGCGHEWWDGGVDVGMDHGGETELKIWIPLWMLFLNADSSLTGMAWLPRTCRAANTSIISFKADGASCWRLDQLCYWSAQRGWRLWKRESCRVVTPKFPTDRLNPQMMVTYGPPNDQTGEGHALMPLVFSKYCSITRGIYRSCLLSSGFCCF